MRFILIFFALFLIHAISAQTLIPFLGKNGLKGLADTTGKVWISPQFTELDYLVESDKLFFYAKKDGKRMRVLRSGEMFEDKGGGTISLIENYEADKVKPTETWTQVLAIDFSDKTVFKNQSTGKTVETARLQNNGLQTWFPEDGHSPLGNGFSWNKARYGFIRVVQPSGRYNFLDSSLQQIFPQDVVAGTAVDNEFFVLANDTKLNAIGHRSGKIRTNFQWEHLRPSGRKGIFVAGKKKTYPATPTNTGLIDADGNYLMPPTWYDIRPAGTDWLIVDTQTESGLMDYSGKVILPLQEGWLEYTTERYFIHKKAKSTTLINDIGENVLPFPVDFVHFYSQTPNWPAHFQYQIGKEWGLLDLQMKPITSERFGQIVVFRKNGETFFQVVKHDAGGKAAHGLLDFSGKTRIPIVYQDILRGWDAPYFRVKKDELYGILDLGGASVLPCQFEEITLVRMENSPNPYTIYGKEPNKNLWMAYDSRGKRLPEFDCLHPNSRKNELLFQQPVHQGQAQPVVFADGKKTMLPPGPRRALLGVGSTKNFLVVQENTNDYELFNTDMKPLLPKGFSIPSDEYNPRAMKHLSLVTVWEESAAFQEKKANYRAITERKTPPPSTDGEDPVPQAADENTSGFYDQAAERDTDYLGTGVLNSKGEWALPPAKNVRYRPVSEHLVLEYALSGLEREQRSPRKLHRVAHPKPVSWEISYAQDLESMEHFDNGIVWQSQVATSGSGTESRCTWFTKDGEQLSDFKYITGPPMLINHNLVAIDQGGQKKWQLVNKKLEKIKDLSALEIVPTGLSLYVGYFSAKMNGKWGLLDSLGQEVMPFEFETLEPMRYLPMVKESKNLPDGKSLVRLLDFKGKEYAASQSRLEENQEEGVDRVFVTINSYKPELKTLVFTKKGVLKMEIIGGRFQGMYALNGDYRYAKMVTPENQYFFVDLQTGVEFREKN